jgi:hypothetical protein
MSVEQFLGPAGMIETSENHRRHFRGPQQETMERSPRNITIDSVAAFVQRIRGLVSRGSTGLADQSGCLLPMLSEESYQ